MVLLINLFRLSMFIVLIGKILNWFLNFNEVINDYLNTAMFSLLGIFITIVGFAYQNKLVKALFIICGSFLIITSFIEKNDAITWIAIVALLAPFITARFHVDEEEVESI